MIDVSTYWTLPPSSQGMVRDEVAEYENDLQMVVGHYIIHGEVFLEETSEVAIEFSLFCSGCYHTRLKALYNEYTTPLTKEEYLDKNHDMHGEKCEKCKKPLA